MAAQVQEAVFGVVFSELRRLTSESNETRDTPIQHITPNPYNPQHDFDEQEIAALAASIEKNGLLRPIIVRPASTGSGWELVSGQRRLLAFKRLRRNSIPAIVQNLNDKTVQVLTIIENTQRPNLDIVEVASGYYRLKTMFGFTQDEISQLVGKSRSAIANALRVLKLPLFVRTLLRQGRLNEGHARVLLSIKHPRTQRRLAEVAARESWTVARLSRAAQHANRKNQRRKAARTKAKTVCVADERLSKLSEQWKVPIYLFKTGAKGEIRLVFNSHEEFERIFQLITHKKVEDII